MKKMNLRLAIIFVVVVFAFIIVVKADKRNTGLANNNVVFTKVDTLRPDYTQEKRITRIEIINGKKKVFEHIIKMKGDSIVEEKTIEKEMDSNEGTPFMDDDNNQMFGGFEFHQIDPSQMDSLFNHSFGQFDFGSFGNDSLMRGFGFSMGPDFKFDFNSPFMGGDIFEKFGFLNDEMIPQFDEKFRDMLKGGNLNEDKSHESAIPSEKKGFKTLKQIIGENLFGDGFVRSFNDSYKFLLNEKGLKINGKKQSKEIYEKYKKVIEDNIGIELSGEFEYKFFNSESLKKNLRRL